jgi:peroxiredoxin
MSTEVDRSLAEKIDEMEKGMAGQAPAELLEPFAAERAQLDQAGVPDGVPAPGTPMPDGELLDVHGGPTSLSQARGGGPAVVVFYRGAWCPYCNLTLRSYEEQLAGPLGQIGVGLIAISPQKPDGSLSMEQKHDLSYTVLSDPGNQIAGKLGILTSPSDGARKSQAALGVDVAAGNADGTDVLPMPTVVVVDRDGSLRWIDVHPNYSTRTEPSAILEAVASL